MDWWDRLPDWAASAVFVLVIITIGLSLGFLSNSCVASNINDYRARCRAQHGVFVWAGDHMNCWREGGYIDAE